MLNPNTQDNHYEHNCSITVCGYELCWYRPVFYEYCEWDIAGRIDPTAMCTDANSQVTTTAITHLPEQQATIHIIPMVWTTAWSGAIPEVAHIGTEYGLAASFTIQTVRPMSFF